jgi:O-antigen ligase
MSSIVLFIIAIGSFLFYGVVGEDKTWVLGPGYVGAYIAIAAYLLRRACRKRGGGPAGLLDSLSASSGLSISILWLFFLLWAIAMIPLAAVPYDAKLRVLYLGVVIGSYWVGGQELKAFKDNRILLGALILIVMGLSLYGLVNFKTDPMRILWSERYTDHYLKPGYMRLASTYICPNHFAHLIQMLLPFCLALLFIPQSGIYLKILAGYSFLAMLPPLFLTASRAGWLGSIAGVGIVLCLMALRRSKKLFVSLAVLVPVCSVLLLFGAWRFSEKFQYRMKPVVEFLQGQAEEGLGSDAKDFRPQTWMDTIDMIKAAPAFGYGPGNYIYSFPEYRKRFRGVKAITGHPHNEYLELMADYGLVGFGLFTLAWMAGLIQILRASLKAEETRHAFMGFAFLGTAAGTMVHSFFDFEMHEFPNALVFALLAALAAGPLAHARRRASEGNKLKRPKLSGLKQGSALNQPEVARTTQPVSNASLHREVWRRVGAWILGCGYLLGALVSVQMMTSAVVRKLGDEARELKNPGKAAPFYRFAAKVDPSNWRALRGMGLILFNQRYYALDMDEKMAFAGEEREWFEKAYAQNSKKPEVVTSYGNCLLFLGKATNLGYMGGSGDEQIERGLDLLREACRYRPFNEDYWLTLGIELRKAGYYQEALNVFDYAQQVKRTRTANRNLVWIKNVMASGGKIAIPEKRVRESDVSLADMKAWIDQMGTMTEKASADSGLLDLLEQMGREKTP